MAVRLMVISLLIPISFEIAGFRFTPALLTLFALFPIMFVNFFSGRAGRMGLIDALFFFYVFWTAITILENNPNRFVAYTGTQGLNILGGYLVGRVMIRDRDDFSAFIHAVFWAVAFSLPFALYESLFDVPLILRFVEDYTPFATFNENMYPPRMGFFRAQFVFVHPIHYGMFCSLAFATVFVGLHEQLRTFLRWAASGVVSFCCFLAVSSGPFLSMLVQAGIFGMYRAASRFSPRPWRLLSGCFLGIYTVLELASNNSAFVAVSSRLAFNPATAYYRTLIWQYGTEQVMRTPILGNGYNYWPRPFWMTTSVDNMWLLIAMVHGLPALIAFSAAILVLLYRINRRDFSANADLDYLRLGWTLSMLGFMITASTVAIWGEIQIFFMILFGSGYWMLSAPGAPRDAAPEEESPAPERVLRYTRFPRPEPGRRAS